MDVLETARVSLIMAFRTLPLLLISFITFLAVGLGNMSMFLLLLGHAIIVPLVTEILHFITKRRYPATALVTSDVAQLVTSMSAVRDTNRLPSYWMQHVLFFFGYLLANGVGLYRLEQEKGVSDNYYENRKAKATAVITISVLAAVGFSVLRYFITGQTQGAETLGGIGLAFVFGGGLGYAWYQFAAYCGARHADVFGVAPSLVPVTAREEKAMSCVYSPKP